MIAMKQLQRKMNLPMKILYSQTKMHMKKLYKLIRREAKESSEGQAQDTIIMGFI